MRRCSRSIPASSCSTPAGTPARVTTVCGQLADNVQRWGCTGVKLYTAEWRDGSRGWTLKDPEAFRFLERCQELGVKNIHLHKGPTIWPLDKDGFDVNDVDVAATTFTDLNFIVEHVGLPRIEDFCFIAVQEPNVYAGLSVVIGGLMHARPKMFAKVMGELLFFLGEDRLIFGSDYAIWEPRWQIEGFVDWDYPSDEFSDYPRVNADHQEEDPRPERRPALRPRRSRRVPAPRGRCRAGHAHRWHRNRYDNSAHRHQRPSRRPSSGSTRFATPSSTNRSPDSDSWRPATWDPRGRDGPAPGAHLFLPAELRVHDGGRRPRRSRSRPRCHERRRGCRRPLRRGRHQRWRRPTKRAFVATFGDLAESELDRLRVDFLRKAVLAATDRVCEPRLATGHSAGAAGAH